MKERNIQIALIILFVVATTPIAVFIPSSGLDSSWLAIFNWAVGKEIEFGKDIIFTAGPLGFMISPINQFLITFIYNILLSFILIPFFKIENKRSTVLFLIFILTTALIGIGNLIQYVISIAMVLLASKASDDKKYYLYMIYAILITVPLMYIKTNSIAMLAFAVILADIILFKDSRKIFLTPLLTVWTILFWVIIGQPIENIPVYFTSSFEIMSGYNDAMIPTNGFPIYNFITVIFLIILTIFHTIKFAFKKFDGNLKKIILLLAILAPLFIAFKYGFVRHDSPHYNKCYLAILLINSFMSITIYKENITNFLINKNMKYITVLLSTILLASITYESYPKIENNLLALTGNMDAEIQEALETITHYKGMFDNETIDSYPFYQGTLIASDLNYKPRPVIQSYSAYTKELRELNSNHLLSDDAPENILFAIDEIDNRLPTMMDSPSWIHILNRYDLVGSFNKINILELHFKKKDKDKFDNLTFKEISSNEYAFNEIIEVPKNNSPIFVSMKLKKTAFGKLISFLFRGQLYKINLTVTGGETLYFRVIAGMIETPVLLSPLVDSTESFLDFYNNENLNSVSSFSIAPEFAILTKNNSTAFEKFIAGMMATNKFELKFYTLEK